MVEYHSIAVWCQAETSVVIICYWFEYHSIAVWCQAETRTRVRVVVLKYHSIAVWCQAETLSSHIHARLGISLYSCLVSS